MPNRPETAVGDDGLPVVEPGDGHVASERARATIKALKPHYRSGESDLAGDFFLPCLSSCVAYRRAVGFFTSSALITWANVLPKIVRVDNVKVQLLASPVLSDQDRLALRQAATPAERSRLQQQLSDQVVLNALAFAESPENLALRLKLFAWLVATERLEIRFAFAEHVDAPGLFHEKIGVFEFPWGDTVAFTGSANETNHGHSRNYETIDVFRDWVAGDVDRVRVKISQFADAWNGKSVGLRIRHLSLETLNFIKTFAPDKRPLPVTDDEVDTHLMESSSRKWRHQDEAVAAFLEARRGVLEMATGTGKTRTALRICRELGKRGDLSSIIVTTDGTDLLNQWHKQLLEISSQLGKRFALVRHYDEHHDRDRFVLDPVQKILLISRKALPPALRSLSPTVGARTILIHDEVHGLGSPGNRRELSGLSDVIRYRLGLSATPEREYDDEGNDFIEEHIGPTIFQFGVADAIRRRIMSPFEYYPLLYTPDDSDKQRIQRVYARAAARKAEGNPLLKEQIWTELARVHKTSQAKLPIFQSFIHDHQDLLARCIVFVETREYGEEVLNIVHRYRHDFHTYYAADEADTLLRFARGDLECLITCHRLSQGIDIQSLQNVILFSSARARLEIIQRMGRCLRFDPANPDKRANVVDFVRTSAPEDRETADDARRDWLTELSSIQPEGQTA